MPSIVPSELEAATLEFYFDRAREICRRLRNKAHLTDDEMIVLALVAAQLALTKYVEPGERDSDATLEEIMNYLDREELNAALSSKMDQLLEGPRASARDDAPGGAQIKQLDLCKDPAEPSGS